MAEVEPSNLQDSIFLGLLTWGRKLMTQIMFAEQTRMISARVNLDLFILFILLIYLFTYLLRVEGHYVNYRVTGNNVIHPR